MVRHVSQSVLFKMFSVRHSRQVCRQACKNARFSTVFLQSQSVLSSYRAYLSE